MINVEAHESGLKTLSKTSPVVLYTRAAEKSIFLAVRRGNTHQLNYVAPLRFDFKLLALVYLASYS